MSFAISFWLAISGWARSPTPAPALPAGWRLVDDRRDTFAEFSAEFIKEDLLLWAQIVLPASIPVSELLAYYAATWDFLCNVQRLDAQNLLKGVKGAFLKTLSLREHSG